MVSDLSPCFARIGQARPWVLHKGLDQIARFWRLSHWQAAVACGACTNSPPHGRVVAGLNLGTLSVGLLGVAWHKVGIGLDLEDVGTLHGRSRGLCQHHRRSSGGFWVGCGDYPQGQSQQYPRQQG